MRELRSNKGAALDPGPVAVLDNPKGLGLAGASERWSLGLSKGNEMKGCLRIGFCLLLLFASRAWSEELGSSSSCNARVDVWQAGSKKSNFSKKLFTYKARVRSNTRACSVVEWQLSWDYHRLTNGKLEKDTMLMTTTIESGNANATEEGEIQAETDDAELNFRAEDVSCRLCDEKTVKKGTVSPEGGSASAARKYFPEENTIQSTSGIIETSIKFINKSGQPIKVYWLDYEGKRKLYAKVKAEDSYAQKTYVTHPWLITDADDNAWYVYFPDAQPRTVEIIAPRKK